MKLTNEQRATLLAGETIYMPGCAIRFSKSEFHPAGAFMWNYHPGYGPDTPWGQTQTADMEKEGIVFHSTASHGGYKVSAKLNEQIPDYMRNKNGWYEEDCEWAVPVAVFPAMFSMDGKYLAALETLKRWLPEAYERFTGMVLLPGESHTKDYAVFKEAHKHDLLGMAVSTDKNYPGFVRVFAGTGGRNEQGGFPPDAADYLVPAEEYSERRAGFDFIVDPKKHRKIEREVNR